MKHCSIVAYIQRDPLLMIREIDPDDFLICADIGLSYCLEAGRVPDLIIGDFDSYEFPEGNDLIKDVPVVRLPVIKDHTDLDISIQKAAELGYTDISVYGGLGGRVDQTVANIQLMIGAKERGIDVTLKDPDNEAMIVTDSVTIKKKEGYFLSLFAVNGDVSGLSVKDTKYELDDAVLTESFPLGVSNDFGTGDAEISLDKGMLLVVLSGK